VAKLLLVLQELAIETAQDAVESSADLCTGFWDVRVAAAGLSPSDTKIPEDPDQTEFVERWFEFYQGYRIEKTDDGREERIALFAEPLKDADPGHLPRSLEELQSGRRNTLASDASRRERLPVTDAAPHVSVEDALDQLLEEAEDEEGETASGTNRVDNVDSVPTGQDARARLDEAYAEAQAAVEAAQRVRDRAEARLNNAGAELAVVRERLRRIRRQQITTGNFVRVFGTREDVQSEDYVSPITSMFIRQAQWGRQMAERQRVLHEQEEMLRNFEDVHRQSTREVPNADASTPAPPSAPSATESLRRISLRPQHIGDSHTFLHNPLPLETSADDISQPQVYGRSSPNRSLDEYLARFADYMNPSDTSELRTMLSRTFSSPAEAIRITGFRPPSLQPQPLAFAGLDGDSRPEPKKDEAMQVKLECKICLQQIADTACLPCGHLSMCEWCAEQWVPTKVEDRTRPRNKGVRCPCCRARVKSRVKIYIV
jgi:hypothetical protein